MLIATSYRKNSSAKVVHHAGVAAKMDDDVYEDEGVPAHKHFSCCGIVSVAQDMDSVCVLETGMIFPIQDLEHVQASRIFHPSTCLLAGNL